MNANLIQPGETQPGVSKLATITAPLPTEYVEKYRYYANNLPNSSMMRSDGKRISFLHGIFETNIKADIEFLDKEVADGHPNLTKATSDQIVDYKKYKDPKGTLREEVKKDIEQELVTSLLEQIESGKVVPGSPASKILDQLKLQNTDRTKILGGVSNSESLKAISATK